MNTSRFRTILSMLLLAIAFAITASCTSFTSTDAAFEPVIAAHDFSPPVDSNRLEKCIRSVLLKYDWILKDSSEGVIVAEYVKSGGAINAVIKFTVDSKGYVVEYVSSKGLDYDPRAKTIHRNYVRWVRNLVKDINIKYLEG